MLPATLNRVTMRVADTAEAGWEFAARGGLESKRYVWGDEFQPAGRNMANTWQGVFPVHDTGDDGFAGTSSVDSFPANGYGLYDLTDNVWQWCSDWYRVDAYVEATGQNVSRNPGGPPESYDPADPYAPKRWSKEVRSFATIPTAKVIAPARVEERRPTPGRPTEICDA